MPTDMPTVSVTANNDGPRGAHNSTAIGVIGSNFPPGTEVNIDLGRHRGTALGGTALVQADGTFGFSPPTIQPPLSCGYTVIAIVTGSDGIRVEGSGDVFCP
jgi:hypothetical protein